jgi:hypothetical protein
VTVNEMKAVPSANFFGNLSANVPSWATTSGTLPKYVRPSPDPDGSASVFE